jgi:hypothetical protein
MLLFSLDQNGKIPEATVACARSGCGPDAVRYVTTSHGNDDKVLRITPT